MCAHARAQVRACKRECGGRGPCYTSNTLPPVRCGDPCMFLRPLLWRVRLRLCLKQKSKMRMRTRACTYLLLLCRLLGRVLCQALRRILLRRLLGPRLRHRGRDLGDFHYPHLPTMRRMVIPAERASNWREGIGVPYTPGAEAYGYRVRPIHRVVSSSDRCPRPAVKSSFATGAVVN